MCPSPAPVPVTKMCHTLYVPAFPIPTLSQRSPPPLSVLIRQPNLQPLSPSSGFPNHNSIQVGLCPILQCSDPTPHSPSSSLLCISCLLTAQPYPSLSFHSSLTLSPNHSQTVMSFTCCLSPDPQTGNTPQHPALIHSGQTLIQSSNPNHQNLKLALH